MDTENVDTLAPLEDLGRAATDSELWLQGQKQAFESVLHGATLRDSLKILIETAVLQFKGKARCAFYIANRELTELHHVAGMTDEYARAVEGFKISPDGLACGLAVHTGMPRITPDVRDDPRWGPWLWLAEKFDYRACWSFPVTTAAGHSIGSFGIYFQRPRTPTPRERELAGILANAAGIIIGRYQETEERERAEDVLRKSERLHRTLFESIDEGACIIERLPLRADGRRDYRYVATNRAMQTMFGIRDLTGESIRDNFPDEVEAWYDDYDRVLETGSPIRFQRESVPQSMFLEMFLTRVEDGNRNRLLVVVRDITGRKRAESVQREDERRQGFLLRFSDTIRTLNDPDAIATTATRLVAGYFEVDRCFISRISRDEGKAWIEHETRRPGLASVEGEVNLADFPEVMRIAETATMIFRDIPADPGLSERDKAALGGLQFGAFIAAVLRNGVGNYFWDLVIASIEPRDWSPTVAPLLEEIAERTWLAIERARTERALLETEKLAVVGRLASSIAHEINNPLEAITNLLYLTERTELPPDAAHYLRQAQSELSRVSQITVETLRFSRQNTSPTAVRLSDLIESVVSLHEIKLKSARVSVERRYQQNHALMCYPNELRQVIANLIGNAIESMSGLDDSRLLLSVRDARDPRTQAPGIRLTVGDTGSGMSRATISRIWEPFFTTKGATGTGLGLWVTQEIIRKHQGSVSVRSSTGATRHGSVFSVFLPRERLKVPR